MIFARRRTLILTFMLVCASSAPSAEVFPKPYVVAPNCTDEELRTALEVVQLTEEVVACHVLVRSVQISGVAIALRPHAFFGRSLSLGEFRQLQRELFRDQSIRLRNQRDISEAVPGDPPAHGSIPLSLFVTGRTPLGIFAEKKHHIGFADLVPQAGAPNGGASQYPLLYLDMLVLRGDQVFRLIQISTMRGPMTLGSAYRALEDWAYLLNGRDRPENMDE